MPRHIVCLTFDFDTESGFIARGLATPTMLSRGEFGLTGARRILDLAKSRGIPMTWFVPGFTIESHRAACDAVVEGFDESADGVEKWGGTAGLVVGPFEVDDLGCW